MDLLSVSFGIFFWHTVALLCVFFLLKRFAFKTILESLEQRRKKIDESIAYSQLLEGEIKNIEKIRNEQIQCLKEEKNKTLEEIKNIREKLFSETKKEAQDLREVLIKKAQEEAEQLKIRMKEQYNAQLGLMAIKISEHLLKQELSTENKRDAFINEIVNSLNPSFKTKNA